jgi:hypothetical protein
MPKNGETNQKFGFYQNLCCGKEIVVPEGNEFPDCPNHPKLTTIWKPLIEHHPNRDASSSSGTPHFKVGDEVRVVGTAPQKGDYGKVVEVSEGPLDHIYRYLVRLQNGLTIKFFGFELELTEEKSSRVA